jgi:hypothetical protein
MKQFTFTYRALHRVAKCPTLICNHIAGVEREYGINVHQRSHAPALALIKDISSIRKMMVRIIQVQHEQINKYWKSIRDARRTVKRGVQPHSLDDITTETMIQMTLRMIQDMKDAIPSLVQPLVARIHRNLCKLQQRMLLFKQSQCKTPIASDDCRCDCPPCRQYQCTQCHEGNCSRDVVWTDGPLR